ncbi:hypothetical protein [Anaerosalibacter massiliensis]|uniref:Uncharacterized protein n=1 Tax=Anaerosalibacter massiliensis TaxID=1347392 RepID=A0A9X2S3W6_9FIRM|nr:hypothetical protein [Anaerosalibacter massiliensis]MCR2042853.1 hypothetical protein [Anaerosalibacter massiliensis]
MEKLKQSLVLNLSNQANTFSCKKIDLSQFNFFAILGLEYLYIDTKKENIPISINIDRSGELSINGLDGDLIDDKNICIYSDKKITKSDE